MNRRLSRVCGRAGRKRQTDHACNNICKEGMVIYTNSPKVRKDRRTTVELILSEHDCQCVTCMRSGNCSLQKIANDLDIIELPFHQYLEHQSWDKTFPLIRDSAKCIKMYALRAGV